MQKKGGNPNGRMLRWEEELMKLIKAKILSEAGTSMRAQANMSLEGVNRLLRKSGTAASGQR